MSDKFEALIKEAYRRNKKQLPLAGEHPDEEDLACFLDGSLTVQMSDKIKEHLMSCDSCAEIMALSIAAVEEESLDVPQSLINRIKEMLALKGKPTFEIFLRLGNGIFELINATGDILMGQELIPAPVLRSRNIKDFKEEVIILKDLLEGRIEARVESKGGKSFDVTVKVTHKDDQSGIKGLRVTLIKDDLELESYLSDSGIFTFEHLKLGGYTLEVFNAKERLALIVLDVKE